ncbi:MAG: MATE family efflux transporter [Culturomica sp.]|jgi:putative MATE family efflux protein|nr:MATE family efflux transporter [Culturomica sp.]
MTKISNKNIWNIAYPIVLGNLAQTLIIITDTAFLGHLNPVALGASMIAGMYYFVFSTIAWGFGIGIQIIVARRLGEGNLKRIGVIFQHGLAFVALLSLLLFSVQHFFTDYILSGIISSSNVLESAVEFMEWRHYGIFFACFNFLFRSLYIGLSNTRSLTYSTVLMAVVNIFLDYTLIFGNRFFPEMGISGAALASVFAEFSATVFFVVYTIIKLPLKEYALNTIHRFEAWLIKAILRLSLPTMLQKLISFGTWLIFFVLVEHMGEIPIAVSGVVRSVYMFVNMPIFALGATANTLTSRLIGSNEADSVKSLLFKIEKLCFAWILPIVTVCLIIPSSILSIYTNDVDLINASIPSLYVVCTATIAMGFGIIYFESVSGTGNTSAALVIETLVLVFYTFGTWFFASYIGTSTALVWTVEIFYGLGLGVGSLLYLRFADWRKKKI